MLNGGLQTPTCRLWRVVLFSACCQAATDEAGKAPSPRASFKAGVNAVIAADRLKKGTNEKAHRGDVHDKVQEYIQAAAARRERMARDREEVRKITEFINTGDLNAEEGASILPQYQEEAYWESFYHKPEHVDYDWYNISLDDVPSAFFERIPEGARLLHAGCGTSSWSESFWKAGWQDAVHCDVSSEAVDTMRARYRAELPNLAAQFEVCDLKELTHVSAFDVVFEKGVFDALLSGFGKEGVYNSGALIALANLLRALRPTGVLISVSFGPPERRIPFLSTVSSDWSASWMNWTDVGAQNVYYIYEIRKRSQQAEEEPPRVNPADESVPLKSVLDEL